MRYALLINERPGAYDGLTADERAAITAEYIALMKDGELLLTDGPFADTKEIFGGFYIVEAGDLDDALELAARVPAARLGGSVEVRPLAER